MTHYKIQRPDGKFFKSSPQSYGSKDWSWGPKGKLWASKTMALRELTRRYTRYVGARTEVIEIPPGLVLVEYELTETKRESIDNQAPA